MECIFSLKGKTQFRKTSESSATISNLYETYYMNCNFVQKRYKLIRLQSDLCLYHYSSIILFHKWHITCWEEIRGFLRSGNDIYHIFLIIQVWLYYMNFDYQDSLNNTCFAGLYLANN